MASVTTSYNNWNFNEQHVQQNLSGGDFVGSHSIILCATAPNMAALSSIGNGQNNTIGDSGFGAAPNAAAAAAGIPSSVFGGFTEKISMDRTAPAFAIPLGVCSDVTVQQARQINKIYEIGSKLSYTVSARTTISLSLSRVLYHGPNLLRMLYAYYPEALLQGQGNRLADMAKKGDTAMPEIKLESNFQSSLPKINDLPGHDNIFLNAASDLFSQPIGLVMYIKDNVHSDVASIFIEDCNLVTHQFGISQNTVVVAEGVQLTADRIRPMKVNVQTTQALNALPV